MARKTQVILTDDIDGSEATSTVNFALDGVTYEIDLNDENAQKLRGQLGDWVSNARRIGGRRSQAHNTESSKEAAKIREWAKENGHQVSERGRISLAIRKAYNTAH